MRLGGISVVVALTSVGCKFDLPALGGDAAPDSPLPTFCYGAVDGLVKPCFAAMPTGNVMLTDPIDTDGAATCTATTQGADGLCVIAGAAIRVEVLVHVRGARPLVLVATDSIVIAGTLDAASHRGLVAPYTTTDVGAGANPFTSGACDAGTPPSVNAGTGGGGAGARRA